MNLIFSSSSNPEDTNVFVGIDTKELGLDIKEILWFAFDTKSIWAVHLLCKTLRKQFEDAIKRTRQRAYKQGYKDGKGHTAHETWFSGRLETP